MKAYRFVVPYAAALWMVQASPVWAGMEDLANEVIAKEKQIDPGRNAQPALVQLLEASCLLNSAFASALNGNVSAMRDAFVGSSANLRKAASQLRALAKDGRYKKIITPRGLKLSSELGSARYADVRDANSLIVLVSDLADETANLIDRIIDNDASFQNLRTAVALASDVNTLVVAFYSSPPG